MSILSAISSLPAPAYHHPISQPPPKSTKLNPYVSLPAHSTLLTNSTYFGSLPPVQAGSVVHILSAEAIIPPSSDNSLVLISRTAQDAYDHALLAVRIAKEGPTVYHYVAATALEGSFEILNDLDSWFQVASVNGLEAEEQGEETRQDTILHAYEAASLSLLKATRRAQRPFIHNAVASSSKVVLNFLPISLPAYDVLDINLASPVPREKLRHAVKSFEQVVVVEAGSSKFGQGWVSMVDALEGLDLPIRSILVASNGMSGIAAAIADDAPITRCGDPTVHPAIPSNSVIIPPAESVYTTVLSASSSPLEILNSPSSLSAHESTSPLYAFGKAVALRGARDRLVELGKSILRAPNTNRDLHEALAVWLLDGTEVAGQDVVRAIGDNSSEAVQEMLTLGREGHWAKKNLWIVISNSWAQDLASSGLHHALCSRLDINLLVYETAPGPFSPLAQQQTSTERKKDLALYALNLGDIYVSSVAVYADYAGVINAMREAESYAGPSLVLAYLPWGEKDDGEDVSFGEKAGPLERLRETKRAVSGGWWPMFRFNPSLIDGERFKLDSPNIKRALTEFLDRQSHLSHLTRSTPSIASSITHSAGTDLTTARKEKARKAYDSLLNSLDGPELLVLYASDSGNAEKVAKRLVSRAKMRGVAATLRVLDEIAGSIQNSLAVQKNVAIITSTAGQGELPQNGREFFKALNKFRHSAPDEISNHSPLGDVRFTVFGMGDSNYWPRKEDYIYYNKAGKDLHQRVQLLGLSELAPLGLGDDSDPDGYQTGYKPWESSLWRGLGVDGIEVSEAAQEETVANEHIKIASDYLRGTILEGLEDSSTGAIGASDAQLTKFHGTYMQVCTVIFPGAVTA